jgi:glycerophosphoryl diester phosphodiesterase
MPALIAHRGFAARYPENTVGAFERALADGADAVEFDVRVCGTGEAVVVHDEAIDRVSDGSGKVADLSLSELEALDVLGSGEGVPSLAAVFERLAATATLHVELKAAAAAPAVERLAGAHEHRVVVSSFDSEALVGLDLPTALLFGEDRDGTLARARDLGCAFVHPHASLVDGAYVERAHDAGLGVNAWTVAPPDVTPESDWVVTDPAVVDDLRAAGVDGFIADAPL